MSSSQHPRPPSGDVGAEGAADRSACLACGFPERTLWPPNSRVPKLAVIEPGDFMYLGACLQCGSLWFSVAHQPYAVFHYLVKWDRSPSEWRRLYQGDHGVTLSRWQVARIRALYPLLGEEDQRDIAWHQRRSYGRSPLDVAAFPEEGEPDLGALLSDKKPRG